VYRNDGAGIFTDIGAGFTGYYDGSAAWGDYDNDGDLDILWSANGHTWLYRNNAATANSAPVAPTGLTASVVGGGCYSAGPEAATPKPQPHR
jgi:hypothetical protein